MVHSYRVGDLAIAMAYAMLDSDDPLTSRRTSSRGYAERAPLDDDEMASLFGLRRLRLCASACIAADQQRERPDNAYLGVSQRADSAHAAGARARFRSRLAEAVLRDACGMRSGRRRPSASCVSATRAAVAPVLGVDLATDAVDRARPEHREPDR